MPSPFPGMNPFLEQDDAWEDFHARFISHARDILASRVGAHYYVKIRERLYKHQLSEEERRFFAKADVGVSTRAGPGTQGEQQAVVAAPLQLPLSAVDVERHSFLEIHDRRLRRVVTVLELLSPTNKTSGPDRDDYLRKRTLLLISPTHLVEIDLRRGGDRPSPPVLPPCDYYALLARVQDRLSVGVWPVGLRERLPFIPIPLSARTQMSRSTFRNC